MFTQDLNIDTTPALKYHPDRNPGRELEFNAKFQAIQSAHEILADPQQRAKYDADRIRSGAHHSFASPARPNPPPRAPASNFPPPPQRAPPTATKANAPPPTPSGTNRYKKYTKPEGGGGPYRSTADETKARASAFKAWEQMRHGQAPAQKGRPVPPRSPKTTAFPPAHEAGSYPPRDSTQKTPWDQSKGPQPPFPGLSRSNTTRTPKKGGFSPGTLGGDEPPARNTSAYFNTGHGDRPDNLKPNSRSTNAEFRAPPPPGQRGPSQTRPDPLRQFKVHVGQDDPVGNSERISTPYATAGGEKTYFSSTPFQTSSKARDKANQNEVYDSEPQSANTSRSRDSSRNHRRGHHSASPRMKSPLERAASGESISSSSTDDSLREDVENLYASARDTQEARAQDRDRLAGHRQTRFQPSVRVENEEETIIPSRSRSGAANGPKSPSRQSRSADKSFGEAGKLHQEGFMEHRIKREAERVHQGVPNLPSPNTAYASLGQNGQQRPLHRPILRPRSWHEKYGAAERSAKQADFSRPMSKGHQEKTSMYGPFDFNPFLSFYTVSTLKWPE